LRAAKRDDSRGRAPPRRAHYSIEQQGQTMMLKRPLMQASTWTVLLALCVLSIETVGAAENTAPQPPAAPPPSTSTYQAVLTQGFEVKNVFLISADASTRLTGTIQQETVMVTLQKGAVTATCWVLFSAWNQQSLEGNSTTCNVLH
jgi:hypothetical protein